MTKNTIEEERDKALRDINTANVALEDLRDEAVKALLAGKEYGAHLLAAVHLKDLEAAVRDLIAKLK